MKSDMYDEAGILNELARRESNKLRVAFFCPQKGLAANFGDIPDELEKMGCEVIWLLGNRQYFREFEKDNKYLIVNDMMKQVEGVDIVVTASVMDCLPNNCYKVIHDHLSFAHFEMEYILEKVESADHKDSFSSLRDIFENLSAFLVFMPFYDLVLTSSGPVTDISKKALELMAYSSEYNGYVLSDSCIDKYVKIEEYREKVKVLESGYSKLDFPINNFSQVTPDNVIVYAPTPNDISGNKNSDIWQSAITINAHGVDMVRLLCESYEDYNIVFKPYKDEIEDVVNIYRELLPIYRNFSIDFSGSDYWDLYKRAKILISDFSSTAYTFSLALGRPVVFFSPNERSLPVDILSKNYCKKRTEIGLIAEDLNSLNVAIERVLNDYEFYLEKVSKFKDKNIKNPGDASLVAAHSIVNGYRGKALLDECVFYNSRGF